MTTEVVKKRMTDEAANTLVEIAKANGGLLKPGYVIAHASREDSPLHKYFDWDDTSAAAKFRRMQAAFLIRVAVQVIDTEVAEPTRVFVSLPSDRNSEGGYRLMADVLDDEDQYRELLEMALDDWQHFQRKYERLKEFKPLFKLGQSIRQRTLTKGLAREA